MKTLKLIVALFVFTIVLPCCLQNAGNAVAQKNIGLQLYSLRGDVGSNSENIDEVISRIAEMGYKYVETASYDNGKIYGLSPEEFKAKLAAKGMFALSAHAGRELARDISQTKWDEIWAWWDKCIADHKAAGMKYIITASMPQPETLEGLKAYCDYYNKIGEKCKAAGLKFGYHNHSFEFEKRYPNGTTTTKRPDGTEVQRNNEIAMYDYMVENTDPDKVFFEMDVYWTVMGQRSPVELFKKYPGRFLVLHIKDQKELGESGMVGFDAIFKHIGTAGAKYLIVEVERYDLPTFESVKVSLDYLNNATFVKADYSK